MNGRTAEIVEHLARALGEGPASYAQVLAAYWGEGEIDLRHDPALPQDAPMSREAMLRERTLIDQTFAALMPDFRYEAILARAVGETAYLFCDQVGTLADGTRIRSPLCTRMTIRAGRIERVVLNIDPDANAPLTLAFAKAADRQGHP